MLFRSDGKNPRGTYRMYYLGWQAQSGPNPAKPSHPIVACYAESADGIHWVKPVTGRPFGKIGKTNIVLDADNHTGSIDNFMVFRDDNPDCPPAERYKGIAKSGETLRVYPSADGLHFTEGPVITDKGAFDSLNVFFTIRRRSSTAATSAASTNPPIRKAKTRCGTSG